MRYLCGIPHRLSPFASVWVLLCFLTSSLAVSAADTGAVAAASTLPDVAGHWAESEVRAMATLDVAAGFPDGSFRPEEKVTREQFIKLLVVTMGWSLAQPAGRQTYGDVPPDRWSHPYIEAAVDRGVVDGVRPGVSQGGGVSGGGDGGQFLPERPVTRLEVVRWLYRADPQLPGDEAAGGGPGFTDVSFVSPEDAKAVRLATAAGLVRGFPDGRFGPDESLTRAQAATIFWRYLCLPRPVEAGGIYAIRSYEQRELLARLDWAAFGWATLSQSGADERPRIRLDDEASLYRLPPGWEEVAGPTTRFLMVFCDRARVLTALLSYPAWWPEAASEVAGAVTKLGMKGVLIDFEYLRDKNEWGGPGLANAYVGFLKEVKSRLPSGALLMVAVPPRNVPGYFDGYDYAAISRVADRVLLMAHDYHEAGFPSPSAPLPAVAAAVKEMLAAGVDPSQIVLGLSLTAHQWVLDREGQVRRMHYPSLDTVYQSVEKRTAGGQGSARFDPVAQMPVFSYVQDGDEYEKHVVWYEDLRSLTAKVALARRFRLSGVSLWRLGIIPAKVLDGLIPR